MKYYIYISDAKVDMLFPQVPHDIKKKVATEFKMDLKLLSASRRTEIESEDNRIARLETVVDFIREYGNLGSVDEPDEYIEDTILAKWVSYDAVLKQYGFQPAVYFTGETEKTVFGLGGSSHHLIGNAQGESHQTSSTVLGVMVYCDAITSGGEATPTSSPEAEDNLLKSVRMAARELRGPTQNVEFVAKRLKHWPASAEGTKGALIATPLYVAMAD